MTQAQMIVERIRTFRRINGRWPTYGDIAWNVPSVCFWKRLAESGHKWLAKGEKLERDKNRDGLVVFKIVRGAK